MAPPNRTIAIANVTIASSHNITRLSHSQDLTIEIIERIGAAISVPCVISLIWTFLGYQRLRTPSNTLLFNASPANLFAGIASLIGRAGLSRPNAATCQVQGFFLEWFMQADPYWACAGAVNVMLVFFLRFNAEQLRRLNVYYWFICYGIPSLPAIFGLIYRKNGEHMYGDATLWCWYSNTYIMTRLYAYYIPIWTVVSLAIFLYILVGIKIHRNRVLLSSLQSTSSTSPPAPSSSSRTFSHHVTYSPFPLPDSQFLNHNTSTVTVTASPNLSKYSVFRSIFSSLCNLFAESTHLSPSDRTSLAYSRVAFLFLASNLITWVPASINRVYAIRNPDNPNFTLNVLAAIVLPLQGLWNCVIYLIVNKSMIKGVLGEWKGKIGWFKGKCGEKAGGGGSVMVVDDVVQSFEMDDDKMQDLREALECI